MPLGLGLGLGLTLIGGGGAVDPDAAFLATLPSGAIGVWMMDKYSSSDHAFVPNLLSTVPASKNLFGLSRRLFNNTNFWLKSSSTIVDEAVADSAGLTQASTVAGVGAWSVFTTATNNLPIGTYTIALNVKRNSGTDQVFAFSSDNGSTRSSVMTATSAWQRFSYTFARASLSGINRLLLCSSDGATNADLQIADFELYSGSSDLGPQALAGHLYVGRTFLDSLPTYASGALDFSSSKMAFAQFPATLTLQDITVSAVVRKKVSGAGSTHQAFLSRVKGYTNATAYMEQGRTPAFLSTDTYAGGLTNLWELFGQGWHVITQRQKLSGTRMDTFIDTCKLSGLTASPASFDGKDLGVSYVNSASLTANYEIAAIILWNRALTDSEIRA